MRGLRENPVGSSAYIMNNPMREKDSFFRTNKTNPCLVTHDKNDSFLEKKGGIFNRGFLSNPLLLPPYPGESGARNPADFKQKEASVSSRRSDI
jgi:hypothetical protein